MNFNLSPDYKSHRHAREDNRLTTNVDRWYRLTGVLLICVAAFAGVYVVFEMVAMFRMIGQ